MTQPAIVAERYDISSQVERVVQATRHLVEFRDGLMGHLMWLAEHTADLSCPDAAEILHRPLLAFGRDEAYRRGVQITTIAGDLWGLFPEVHPLKRREALRVLRAVCLETATAVRDELYRDTCICREATR